jgi:hypothetical protein
MFDISKWDTTTWVMVGLLGYFAYNQFFNKPVVVVTPPTAS